MTVLEKYSCHTYINKEGRTLDFMIDDYCVAGDGKKHVHGINQDWINLC